MTSAAFLSIFLFLYLAGILFLALKFRDIVLNPEKYENPELVAAGDRLEETKRYLPCFKSLGHQYSLLCLLFPLALTAAEAAIGFGIQKLLLGDRERIFLGVSLAGLCALFFLNIIVGMLIVPLAIKKPFFEVVSRSMLNVSSRPAVYKRAYLCALIFFILTFPFGALGANTYCGFNETGIVYSGFFQAGNYEISYDNIEYVRIGIFHNKQGNPDTFFYEIGFNGKERNINRPNTGIKYFTEQVYAVHRYLEEKSDCTAEITPPDEKDLRYMEEHMNDREKEIARYLFEGFHRP